MQTHLGTIVCKFCRDRVMCVVVVAICAKKFTDGQTDDGRRAIALAHELIIIIIIIIIIIGLGLLELLCSLFL